jgi:hypothetical protein
MMFVLYVFVAVWDPSTALVLARAGSTTLRACMFSDNAVEIPFFHRGL